MQVFSEKILRQFRENRKMDVSIYTICYYNILIKCTFFRMRFRRASTKLFFNKAIPGNKN